MSSKGVVGQLIRTECRREVSRLASAAACAALVGASSVLLLGLSGWFIAACALAGAAAFSFNTLLPAAAIRLLAIVRTGGRYAEQLAGHDGVLRAFSRIRPALFRRLADGPVANALALSNGEAVARLVDDVAELEQSAVLKHTTSWTASAALAAGLLLLGMVGGWTVAVSTLLILLALRAAIAIFETSAAAAGRGIPAARGALRDAVALLCHAPAEIRVYDLAGWMRGRIGRRSATLLAAQRRVAGHAALLAVAQAVLAGAAGMLAFLLALRAGAGSRAHIVEAAITCALAAGVTVEGAASHLRGRERRVAAREAGARLEEWVGASTPVRTRQSIAAARADIDWLDGSAPIEPGTIVALQGPSGCGKTTLIEQIAGLRDVAPGRAAIGDRDVHDLGQAAARACFAYAPQEAYVLIGTVRDNLRLARAEATDEEMWEALHDAALETRVRRASDGLDLWLGNEVGLSGGEVRRLGLARAYLRDAPWLLLDEPTENLDAATEAMVVERLHARLKRRRQGALIVTHRSALLAICDVVRTMVPDGRILVDADAADHVTPPG